MLPAVASTTVPPVSRRPSSSAAAIMESAMRSLIEPPGFWLSSLTNRRQRPVSRRVNSTRGVLPIRPKTAGSLGVRAGRTPTLVASNFAKAGDSGDINDNRAFVANVFARPARLYGLQVGGSYYRDKLTPKAGINFDEWIASAHVVWTKEHPEVLAEYANVHHQDLQTLQTFNTTGYYVQLAYRFPWQENKWKPYYRFEYIHRPTFEPVWDFGGANSVVDLVGSLVGVRYDITSYAAFKGEYRRSRHAIGEPIVNGAFFQTAFTF